MNLRTLAIVVFLGAVAAFAALNWTAFTTPTALTLGYTEVQAPVGLVMLGVTGVLCLLFLVFVVFQQAGVILEARRTAKELKAQRELADKAEASRFTELRGFIEAELRRIEAQSSAGTRELSARIAQLDEQLQDRLADVGRRVADDVGQVVERLDRLPAPPGA